MIRSFFNFTLRIAIPVMNFSLITMAGCGQESESTSTQTPPEVKVVEVIQKDVPIHSEWVGTTDGHVNAQIRSQVTGYLLRKAYAEGAYVRKGRLLFELDPSKFKAELAQASAELRRERAQLEKRKLDVQRDTPLAKEGAISQKELADSVQAYAAAKASVAAAVAAVDQAKLNLGWTRIVAPIDGVVGIAEAQIGDLIQPSTELTSMSTLDPIRVYFPISEQEYLHGAKEINKSYEERKNKRHSPSDPPVPVELILSDGTVYPQTGQFFLADRQVDVKTGTIRMAALFKNPGNLLRPGLFVRVRAVIKTKKGALLVPQRAVTEMQGNYQIYVVTKDNKVEIRPAKVAERIDNLWIIDEGLNAGDQVVVEGLQKLRADMVVNPQPFEETAGEMGSDVNPT